MNRKQRRSDGKKAKAAAPDAPRENQAQAEQLYRQILGEDERDPFALHSLGVVAHQAGRDDIAADLFARAIAGNDAMPDFHFNHAIALKALGRLDDAAAALARAIALKPDYAQAHNNLGNIRKAQGRGEEAIAAFGRALQHRPGYAEAHYNLGTLFRDFPEIAAAHFHACLAADPDDTMGARLLLARLGVAQAPPQASRAHLEKLYAERSKNWDRGKAYRGHALVADALRKLAPRAGLDILDAGCGTGLAGPLLRDLAARLDGVDFSAAMLEKARQKQAYDNLYQDDIASFMAAAAGGYGAIASAATLVHFGDLAPVFAAAAHALKRDGLFVFTLFPGDENGCDFAPASDPELARGGCYAHTPAYVERVAEASGFVVEMLTREIHERDPQGAPVQGLVIALRLAP